jgi:hypothetical protein
VSIRRYHLMMRRLTELVSFNNYRKDHDSIMNPLFNFLDPTTLLTWLDLRRLAKDYGYQYKVRIEAFMSCFFAMIALGWSYIVAYLFDYAQMDLTFADWIQLLTILCFYTVLCLQYLVSLAFINEETERQIKQFNEIRYIILRMANHS